MFLFAAPTQAVCRNVPVLFCATLSYPICGMLFQVVHNGMTIHPYQHRVLMTGTPMQNIKEELWPLMNFVDQGNFPDLQRFQDKYCKGEPGHEVDEVRFCTSNARLKPVVWRRDASGGDVDESDASKRVSSA